MHQTLTKAVQLTTIAVALFAALTIFAHDQAATAQEPPVRFLDGGLESNFPEDIRFYTSFESDIEIDDVRVRFTTGPATTGQYDYLDLTERTESLIDGELLWRVNTSARYLPPGTTVDFVFEAIDKEGNEYLSDQYSEMVLDARYEWDVVSRGPIHVYYHGPVQVRAERLADQRGIPPARF